MGQEEVETTMIMGSRYGLRSKCECYREAEQQRLQLSREHGQRNVAMDNRGSWRVWLKEGA